jgi:hypothetical protein
MKGDKDKKKGELSLNQNVMFKEKTKFEKIEEHLKLSIFGVLFVLLKSGESDFTMEVVSLLSELFQFLYYPFTIYVCKLFIFLKFIMFFL